MMPGCNFIRPQRVTLRPDGGVWCQSLPEAMKLLNAQVNRATASQTNLRKSMRSVCASGQGHRKTKQEVGASTSGICRHGSSRHAHVPREMNELPESDPNHKSCGRAANTRKPFCSFPESHLHDTAFFQTTSNHSLPSSSAKAMRSVMRM